MLVRANKRLGAGSIDVFYPNISWSMNWSKFSDNELLANLSHFSLDYFHRNLFLLREWKQYPGQVQGPGFAWLCIREVMKNVLELEGGGQTLYSFSCPLLTTKEIWVWIMPAMLYIYVFASLTRFWFWVSRIHETEKNRLLSLVSEKCTVRDPINLQIGN